MADAPTYTDPTFVFNQDCAFLKHMIDRFLIELIKSQSSGASGMQDADQARLESYLTALKDAHDWVQQQPMLDLPETHPRQFPLDPSPVVPQFDNDSIRHICRMLEAMRTELINSQSARLATRLQPFDSTRFLAIHSKIGSFLADYVQKATPLDLPESSPEYPMTGAGLEGVVG